MRICIVGGKLQGLEAVYLSKKAGYESILIDKNPDVPAASLADETHIIDITKNAKEAKKIYRTADVILPATENKATLRKITKDAKGTPLIHDTNSYYISSSKIRSNKFFEKIGIPIPRLYPNADFPLIIKPSNSSGSQDVSIVWNKAQLQNTVGRISPSSNKVIQEFIKGPSVSIEIIAKEGEGVPLLCTMLEFDSNFDCKRVLAPLTLSSSIEEKIKKIGTKIADGLHLTGITDVEAIVLEGKPKVIEIDARLPSQTPTAVYHSSGVNMLELLVNLFTNNTLPKVVTSPKSAILYEHITVSKSCIQVGGEHLMASADNLSIHKGLFGSFEMITNYRSSRGKWVATLIVKEKSLEETWEKRNQVLDNIINELDIKEFSDPYPEVYLK
jgi:pyrrolysine biosynthesis protein PylC